MGARIRHRRRYDKCNTRLKSQYARDEWRLCVAFKRYVREHIAQAFALDAYLHVHLILILALFRLLWKKCSAFLFFLSFFLSPIFWYEEKTNPLRKAGKLYGRHRVLSSSSLLSLSFFPFLLFAMSNKNSTTNMFLSSVGTAKTLRQVHADVSCVHTQDSAIHIFQRF